MRTITITRDLFTAEELRELHPSGFGRALDEHASDECNWHDTSEIRGSLKALDEAVGYDRNYPAYSHRGLGDTADLTGRRAWAWLENALLRSLRVPWRKVTVRKQESRWGQDIGRAYHPGTVPSCPLTGVCYDEDLLDDLRKSIADGMSVGDAMLALGDTAERIAEADLDYLTSEEAFLERCDYEGHEFTANGERV